MVLLLSCFLISCNPEAEDVRRTDPAIVGTWTCTEVKSPVATYTWDLTINADGSFIMDEKYNGDPPICRIFTRFIPVMILAIFLNMKWMQLTGNWVSQ